MFADPDIRFKWKRLLLRPSSLGPGPPAARLLICVRVPCYHVRRAQEDRMWTADRISDKGRVPGLKHGCCAGSGVRADALCMGLAWLVLCGAGCPDRHRAQVPAMDRWGPGSISRGLMGNGPDTDPSLASDGSPFTLQQRDGRWWLV
ncbi:MAG: hypothetical protein KBE04_01940, partial [Phycisphaerae bacterium]|nr:hypothetical protein [Phycisphaerae bacterium]